MDKTKAKKTVFRSFSLLLFITIIEKLIAFVFEALIAAYMGTNSITDAYFTSAELFSLIDSAFLSAITVVALNRYTYHLNEENEERAFEVLSDLESGYLPFMVVLSVLLFVFAKPISYIIAPGYSEQARMVVIRCIRVMACVPTVVCITSIGLAVLRQKRSFGVTGLKSLFISVVGIASVFIFGRGELHNADALSIAYVISIVLYCLLISFCIKRYGHIRLHKPVMSEDLKTSLHMLLPLMVSYGVARVALMVDKIIASTLGVGAVSGLTYAHSLYKVVGAVFVTNLTTIILTDFNDQFTKKEYVALNDNVKKTISIMTVILIPITIISLFYSNEIVKIVYERGKFSPEATCLVGGVLLFYAINFVPVMIQGVYNQVLFAAGDTVRPMWISLVAVIVNLATSIPIAMFFGLSGVAIGTVLSTVVAVILQHRAIKRHIVQFTSPYSMIFLIKCIFSGACCSIAVWMAKKLPVSSLVSFFIATFVGFLVFSCVLLFVREENATKILKLFLSRIRKKFM